MAELAKAHAGHVAADTRDVVDRALQRMRLLAAAVLVFQLLMARPHAQGRSLSLLGEVVLTAVVVAGLGGLATAARRYRGSSIGRLVSGALHAADVLVAVLAVGATSHLEASWVLLVVPVLAGALRFRLRGAFYTWVVVGVLHLSWYIHGSDTGDLAFVEGFGEQVTFLAVVLLVALPAGYLSEHLLIEVRGLARVFVAAEQRSALLEVVAASSQRVNDLDSQVFDAALEATTGLGFTTADLWELGDGGWLRLSAGPRDDPLPELPTHLGQADCTVAPLIVDRATGESHEVAGLRSSGLEAVVMTAVPGRSHLTVLRAVVRHGQPLHPSQVECLRLLAQQAGVALRNGELVTDLHQARGELEHQAFHDELTGIANRALFVRNLEECCGGASRTGRSLALLFLDIDRFKAVNDGLGHEIGDALLVAAVERLQGVLRADALLARMGGDEFTVLLPEIVDPHDAEEVADRICKALTEPFTLAGHEVLISTSVGIAIGDASCTAPVELLRRADIAMYRSKARGRACWTLWAPELDEATLARLQLERDLRRAVDEDEVEVVLQPVLRVDGTVVGAEALARWKHPVRGFVRPAEFIGIAEESDLIIDLGRRITRRSVETACVWLADADPECFVALNVSPRQLVWGGFADELDGLLAAAGLSPDRLLLEITERIVTSGPEAVEALHDLSARGYRLALDDFGQGATSLQHLRHFPLTALKIDRVFVADAVLDERVRTILAAIVSLGVALRLDVIAEGIESQEQSALLIELGCTYLQGYALGVPVEADALPPATARHEPAPQRGALPLPPAQRSP